MSATPIYGATDPSTALFAGRFFHHDGTPAAGVTVTAARMDSTGATPDTAELVTTNVGQAQTDADGYLTIYATTVNYSANYQLTGVIDNEEVVYDFVPELQLPAPATSSSARAMTLARTTRPTNAAVIKAGTGPLLTPAGQLRRVGPNPPRVLANAVVDPSIGLPDGTDGDSFRSAPPTGFQQDPDVGGDPAGVELPPAGLGAEVPPADGKAPTKCGTAVAWAHVDGVQKYKYLPVRGILTGAHSTQHYIYKTAKQTQAGGVLNVAGDLAEIGALGGVKSAWSQTLDWPGAKLANDTTWSLWVQWDYEKWRAWCPTPLGPVKMDVTQWLPWDVAGGSTHKATPMGVSCNYTHKIDGTLTMTTSHSETWGGWFNILAVNLDTKTTQSTSTSIAIIPDNTHAGNNEKDPVYCSTNSLMTGSAWFREQS